MTRLLIIESQGADIAQKVRKSGRKLGSDQFIETFRALDLASECVVAEPYAKDFDPHILHDVDGVVLTGSSVPWSVDAKEAKPLQNAVHAVFQSGLPIWGSCNGMQMAAFLLGGENGESPNGTELGLARDVHLTKAGRSHPMLSGRDDGYEVLCLHRDEVINLPEGAELLAYNDHSPVQAFAYETNGVRFWGTQYHPEFFVDEVAAALKAGQGIFADENGLLKELSASKADKKFARETHARELKNWLGRFFFNG